MYIINSILLAFLVTLISETLVIILLFKPKQKLEWIGVIIAANCITHPLVILSLQVFDFPYLIVEIFAILIEALIYKLTLGLTWKKALFISLIANLVSILTGFVVRKILI